MKPPEQKEITGNPYQINQSSQKQKRKKDKKTYREKLKNLFLRQRNIAKICHNSPSAPPIQRCTPGHPFIIEGIIIKKNSED